ncbi:amino acid/peptide transporter Peptide:H+ symporter family protein [Asticcacaulis biprosthecium C19]|uniref:Amino acid/peptide transporter Peptide:H+ symporter family protein n=1 Tax=Asticcacaulis biprosthecium C19 TaxID=715226 RepID=F4QSY7_9CAUL|nr:oligopeptide:H+ symporter [Asticcacaulis biprosthecium]EGF89857.1 amino acid/peptide transporter Peptide:H+ symporter family protein [Asticcacaulis biprosthecium C19]
MLNIVIGAGILITILTGIPVLLQMRNHPKGLFVCFFAEMWERFSYYGMRALLIYYLVRHFLFDDTRANAQYGAYTTLIYLLPLLGGLIADRWLGTRKAITFGAILLVAGHLGMAIEGRPNIPTVTYQGTTYEFVTDGMGQNRSVKLDVNGQHYDWKGMADGGYEVVGLPADAPIPAILPAASIQKDVKIVDAWAENVFYLAISLIILGVGFMKPNISTIVGQLYREKDPRRDAGFQFYYYGINLGSFWAAALCGYLGENVGWWAGFGLAGIGMLAGLIMFTLGKPWLMGKGEPPKPEVLKEKVGPLNKEVLIYLGGLALVPVIYLLVQQNLIVRYALYAGSLAIIGYVIHQMFTKYSVPERFRLTLAMILSGSSALFFALFEQAGSSLSLFAERNTNLDILSAPIVIGNFVLASSQQLAAMTLPANHVWIDMGLTPSQTQTFNAGFILILAPVFAWLFTYLGRRGADPDPLKKFGFGLANVGLGFLVLVWGVGTADALWRLPVLFLMMTYLFHTIGELTLSPVGLSQQTKLSPPTIVATMMAIWFLGQSNGQNVAAIIAQFASTETVGGVALDNRSALMSSIETFNFIGWLGVGVGVFFFLLSYVIGHWSYGANDTTAEETPK